MWFSLHVSYVRDPPLVYMYSALINKQALHRKAFQIELDEFRATAVCDAIELRKAGCGWSIDHYPICAYIDSGRIEEWRTESLHLRQCSPQNAPVYAILCQMLKQLRPANPLNEPYIAGLLIASALYRRYWFEETKPEGSSKLEIYPVCISKVL